jgi:hypothetical protein
MTKAKALTEEQWLASTEPYVLLRYLRQHCRIGWARGGKRRQRLYACACCRRAWHLFDERERGVVEVAERAADGQASRQQLATAAVDAEASRRERDGDVRSAKQPTEAAMNETRMRMLLAHALTSVTSYWLSFSAGWPTMSVAAALVMSEQAQGTAALQAAMRLEQRRHADLLRDIFRNPFRPALPFDRSALVPKGSHVERVARTIYDERRWDEMPVLADALEEAGCADADLLDHCRAATPHARGCWAVDLILGVT